MQKKIIALAIAAAFSAPAFADTTVYGVVDATVAHVAADHQKSDMLALSSGLSTSRIGFKAVEDLNNGMKAVAVLEYGLDTETSAGVGAARQQMLALAGDFGTVATGYLQTTGYDWQVKYDPTGGSAIDSLGVVNASSLIGIKAVAARAPRALAYISPDMGGVTVAVNYTTAFAPALGNLGVADNAADVKVTAYLLSATYTGGPLSVGGVMAKTSVPGGTGEKSDAALGASYDFGVAKLFATYQNDKTKGATTDTTDKALSVSVVAPVGPGAIAASFAKGTKDAANTGGKSITVAWLQGLSKTTTAYAGIQKVTSESSGSYSVLGNAVAAVNGSSTALVVGLNKKF